MRTIAEVQAEYTQYCAKIGDLEVIKQTAMETVDAQLEPLHNKCRELKKEAEQIMEVQKQVAAQTQKESSPVDTVAEKT